MTINYSKLEGKIKEVYKTQAAFADALGVGRAFINRALHNKAQFSQEQICKSMDLLNIPYKDVHVYFFTK